MCSHLNLLYADRMAMVIISTQLSFRRHKAGNASEDGPALFNEEWELGEVCLSSSLPCRPLLLHGMAVPGQPPHRGWGWLDTGLLAPRGDVMHPQPAKLVVLG